MNYSRFGTIKILLSHLSGYLWAFAAILCWGAMFPIGDALMKDGHYLPASIGMLRYLIATPLLFLFGAKLHGLHAMLHYPLRTWFHLALLGLIGSAAMALLLFIAQQSIPPINASLLESYVPLQVLVLGLFTQRTPSLRLVASITIGFFGTLLVLQAIDAHGLQLDSLQQGDLFIFLSGLCWAIYTAWGRPLAKRLGGLPFTTWTVFFGGLWLLLYHALCHTPPSLPSLHSHDWLYILFLALFPTAIAFFGWNQAQKNTPLAHLSFMEYFTPLVAAITTLLLGRGAPTLLQAIGILVVIASAALLKKE